MLFSIIINTHNQYNLIDRCIKSCINQTIDSNFEIIVSDTSDKKKIRKYKSKNVKIIESKNLSNYPCVNQMFSIKNALKHASGKIICLLDGDDFFHPSKLSFLEKNFPLNKDFLNQDNLVGYNEESKKKILISNKKKYKNIFLYKKLFNSWPKVLGTSAISINKKNLDRFFSQAKPNKWNFLAIDALLIIYFEKMKILNFKGSNLTFKSFHRSNLDSTFSNKFSRKFWKRRLQQHKFYQFINKKKYTNIDYILSQIFSN